MSIGPLIYLVSSSGDYLTSASGNYLTLYPFLSANLPYTVKPRFTASITYTVTSAVPSAPTNVLSRNIGDGSMELSWDAPASGVVDHYDVLISSASGGDFIKANSFPVTHRTHIVKNLPFGYTVYAKVRGVDNGGNEGPLSALARDATASKATSKLKFIAPIGDVIAEGAMFSCLLNNSIVAVTVTTGGTVTG